MELLASSDIHKPPYAGVQREAEKDNYKRYDECDHLTGRKNKFCARRIAAWLGEAEAFEFDVLAVRRIVSSESLKKNCKEK